MYGVLPTASLGRGNGNGFLRYLRISGPYVEDRVDHDLARITTRWPCVEMIDLGVTSFVDILKDLIPFPALLR